MASKAPKAVKALEAKLEDVFSKWLPGSKREWEWSPRSSRLQGIITWKHFQGIEVLERHNYLDALLDLYIGPEARRKVFLFAMTPDDFAEAREDRPMPEPMKQEQFEALEQKVRCALESRFPNSHVHLYLTPSKTLIGGEISWKGFDGQTPRERQEALWGIIHTELNTSEGQRITSILPFTPNEVAVQKAA